MTASQLANFESSLIRFSEPNDPRSIVNRRYGFGDLFVIRIMAVIASAAEPQAIGVWTNNHEGWLKRRPQLPNGMESHLAGARARSFTATLKGHGRLKEITF